MSVAVVLLAGGQGTRLGAGRPKALVPLGDEPLVVHALRRALAAPGVAHVVVVAPSSHLGEVRMAIYSEIDIRTPVQVVAGGPERADSVAAGLALLRPDDDIVLVHDAARALAPAELYARVVHAVRAGHDAVVPGVPVVDTVKQVDEHGHVVATPDRAGLRAVQTPQGFRRTVLEHAHASSSAATDDAGMVEQAGGQVLVIEGDPRAMKITTPEDLGAAERLLDGQRQAGAHEAGAARCP